MTTVARSRANRATHRETAVRLFHALSDETRLAVIDMLRGGERCVCDLQGTLDAAQSRLSFHLKVLKDAGLVTDRREGRWSYYSLNPDRVDEAIESLRELTTPTVERALALHSIQRAAKPAARAKQSSSNGCC
jgi:ArsR family transcriptional regulator, arsenate/arsenite/antimonite-responsive transcriptional repressor